MFHLYSYQYYSNSAISSVYLYEIGEHIKDGFIAAIVIKNSIECEKQLNIGVWDSVNFIHVNFNEDSTNLTVTYKITTTIILIMKLQHKNFKDLSLSGTLTRQVRFIIKYRKLKVMIYRAI